MPRRIFIVDDNLGVRRSLRSFFDSQTGFEVCGEAASGFDAIEKAKEANPDLIVLDFFNARAERAGYSSYSQSADARSADNTFHCV